LATAKLVQLPRDDALRAAHYAEVQMRTGLGDVMGSTVGGIEIRREPGLPPWGMLERIPGQYEIVLCVVGPHLETSSVLGNAEKVKDIAAVGKRCTRQLLQHPSIETLLRLGLQFTKETKLASAEVKAAIAAAEPFGKASMCMLGNSVFAIGDTRRLVQTLSVFGTVTTCGIDVEGARVLQDEPTTVVKKRRKGT
jgi:pantoate kinase